MNDLVNWYMRKTNRRRLILELLLDSDEQIQQTNQMQRKKRRVRPRFDYSQSSWSIIMLRNADIRDENSVDGIFFLHLIAVEGQKTCYC